jgi:hypothetical protein
MAHPLLVGLFETLAAATEAARSLHAVGVAPESLSVVARSHDEESVLARQLGGTPGVELEDSRPAARLGELGGYLLAAVAVGVPGLGSLLAAGPLSAELGEVAGHVAGGLAPMLRRAGVDPDTARLLSERVGQGAILLAVHATAGNAEAVRGVLQQHGAAPVVQAAWE